MMDHPAPPTIYRAHLIELEGCWLDVSCGCGTCTLYPFRRLIEKLGRNRQLGEVASRIRCKSCRQQPAFVRLLEKPYRTTRVGDTVSLSVQLFPPEWIDGPSVICGGPSEAARDQNRVSSGHPVPQRDAVPVH